MGLIDYPLELGQTFKIHDLEQLKKLGGLAAQVDPIRNKDLFDNWSKAVVWNPEQRYEAPGRYSAGTAKMILDSIRQKPNGVLAWLSKRW